MTSTSAMLGTHHEEATHDSVMSKKSPTSKDSGAKGTPRRHMASIIRKVKKVMSYNMETAGVLKTTPVSEIMLTPHTCKLFLRGLGVERSLAQVRPSRTVWVRGISR